MRHKHESKPCTYFVYLLGSLSLVNVTIACCDICSSYAKMGRDRYCHLPRTAVNTK